MAYQPKSYRKFVATAATATLVASAFAPFASAHSFKDVETKYNEAVDFLVSKGVSGYTDGTFKTQQTITRLEAAEMLGKALGLTEVKDAPASGFTDVPARVATLINAFKAKGITNGKTETTFGANDNITRGELAIWIQKAYDLKAKEGSSNKFSDVADRYKTAVQALVDNEITQGTTETTFGTTANAKRGDYALFIKRAVDAATPKVTTATKVENVSATNLKEVVVTFDGTVDKASAEDVEKYSVDSSVELLSATLLEDGKTVLLTVKRTPNGAALQNQKTYKISVKNVKAGTKFVDASNIAFTPVDNTLPEVTEVKSLGTKAVKVTFSEPVKTATSTNFKLDGKSFFGSVSEGSRSVILKPYTSTDLAVGAHKLEVSGVEDFAGFKSLTKEVAFEVVEDTAAPTVKSVSATLETVTVTFSEEVDPETVSKSNVYWKSGADKKAAGNVTQIAPNVFEFDFSANALPGYEVTLFVEGVKDYSGNQITETEVKVRAEVDQTRPEVSEAVISKLNNKNITLKFNKTVKIDDIKYFTLTNAKGDAVAIRTVAAANGGTEDKIFTIETYGELTDAYTLKVIGVRDTTKLQNTMNDYSVTLTGKDTVPPNYVSNSANGRTIIVNFDEKMELATLADPKNYLVTINNKSQQLPAGTEITPVQNGEAVRIVFPEYIENSKVGFNDADAFGANITKFKLLALKDVAGNIITQFGSADISVNTDLANVTTSGYDSNTSQPAKLTAKGVVKVKFDQPIGKAVASDFEVLTGTGVSISSAVADGTNVVTLTLSGSLNNTALVDSNGTAITLAVKAGNKIETTSGNKVVHLTQTRFAVKDGVKPQVQLATGQTRLDVESNVILLPFSETLGGVAADYKHDLVVTNVRTGAVLPVTMYNTSKTGNVIEIALDSSIASTDEYKVSVKANAAHIEDSAGNKAVASSTYLTKVGAIDTVPVVTNITSDTANGTYKVGDTISIKVTFNESVTVAGGAPTILLETGTVDRSATYASGTGSNTLVFNYTVQAGDETSDLDVNSTSVITLAGATIKDAGNNNAILTLKAPGTLGSLGANKDIVVDGVLPVALVAADDADSFKVTSATTATVKFSEPLLATAFAADNANGFTVAGGTATLTKAELQADRVTVLLTGTNFVAGTTTIGYTAGPVKDLAGNLLATFAAVTTQP